MMNFNYQTDIREKALFIETEGGAVSLEMIEKLIKEMIEKSLKNNCKKIYLDGREILSSLAEIEYYQLGEFFAKTLPAIIKLAVVCRKEDFGKLKLFENVAYNRGSNIKVFDQPGTAKNWLHAE